MRVVIFVAAAVLASGAAMLAQDGGRKPDGETVILTGCLGGGPSKFVLTNVAMGGSDGKGQKPSGTPALAASYDLVPRDGLALAAHVGHRVELTGVILAMPKPGAGAPEDTPGGPKGPTAQFAVSSLKMISPLCLQ